MSNSPAYPSPAPSPRFNWMLLILVALLGALAGKYWWQGSIGPLHDPNAVPRAVLARGNLAEDEQATIELFKHASPAVVHITSLALRRDFFSMDITEIPQGTGSGFIWDPQGHVVTNYHVVRNSDSFQVTLADGSTHKARVVGVESDKDLAVLKINAKEAALVEIDVGTSADLEVGQKVFAIGNPFGLDQTLTTGVISGVGREIKSVSQRPILGVIQTDAAINPGNSGGPLLDSGGRLIGVNTAIYSPSGAYAGVGFAVPVDTVNRIVPELIRHGKVIRPGLGVGTFEDQMTRSAGLEGVLIKEVDPAGAAAKAGLHATRYDRTGRSLLLGDQIIGIAGETISTNDDLYKALEKHKVGDTVKVVVRRDGEIMEFEATLQGISTGSDE
ncbi:MAG: S1C family serine protease [Pirellulales bacterium]